MGSARGRKTSKGRSRKQVRRARVPPRSERTPPFRLSYFDSELWIGTFGAAPARRGSVEVAAEGRSWLIPILPVGDLQVGDESLSPRAAMFLAQAMMWYEVAWMLGRRKPVKSAQLEQTFATFTGLFHGQVLPLLLGTEEQREPPRTQAEVIVNLQRLGRQLWSRVPRRRPGRPGPTQPSEAMLEEIDTWERRFVRLKDEVVRPFQRLYGADCWLNGVAFSRLLDEAKYTSRADMMARRAFAQSGFSRVELSQEPFQQGLAKDLLGEPKKAAVEFVARRARARGQYSGGTRALYSAWTRWRRDHQR